MQVFFMVTLQATNRLGVLVTVHLVIQHGGWFEVRPSIFENFLAVHTKDVVFSDVFEKKGNQVGQ